VALSSCEGIWLARLLGDLRNSPIEAVDLKVDNKSVLALMKNPIFHDHSKHIQTKYHFIRVAMDDGDIRPNYIGTEEQLADILTKALPHARIQELRARLGMFNVQAQA